MSYWRITKRTWSEFSDHECSTMAAALAYYTVFALPSVLLIILYVAGSVLGKAAVEGQLKQTVSSGLGPGVGSMVQNMIRSAAQSTTGGTIATILGILGLVYSASGTFSYLQEALNRAWNVKPQDSGLKSMALKRIASFLLVVGVAILVLLSLGAAAVATGLANSFGIHFLGWAMYVLEIGVSWLVFTVLFGVVFKIIPDADLEWRDVKVGAIVTGSLFVIGKFLVGLYLSHSSIASAYGAAGALALLLLWTYYSALIFLFGAEFTQVWARQHGRAIQPSRGAVRITEETEPRKAA